MTFKVGDKVTLVGDVTRVAGGHGETVRVDFTFGCYTWFGTKMLRELAVEIEKALPTIPSALIEVDNIFGGRVRLVLHEDGKWRGLGNNALGHTGPFKNVDVLFDGEK